MTLPTRIGDGHLTVTVHTSPEATFWVNSYLVETPDGLVIMDTQFTLTEAAKVRDMAKALKKPLLAILLTHPHPDHVNGTRILLDGLNSAPVIATQATRDAMEMLAEPKRREWKPLLGDDYPDETVLPDQIVGEGETVVFGGTGFRFSDMGSAESLNESLIEAQEHNLAFVGDLFYHEAHPWLVEGRTTLWQHVLKVASQRLSQYATLLPGHGLPADTSALAAQSDYIKRFQALVRTESSADGTVSEPGRTRIKAILAANFPDWALTSLHDMNITGVAKELKAEKELKEENEANPISDILKGELP